MKENWKIWIRSIAIPLLVGLLAGLFTRNSMEAFAALNQPPLSPPGWLFPVVWTILYLLMGIAAGLVATSDAKGTYIDSALFVYYLQLVVNFFWPIFFFRLEWLLFSFFWLVLLWLLILLTIKLFYRVSKPAAYLMIPYLLWVTFAGYLNLSIYLLN